MTFNLRGLEKNGKTIDFRPPFFTLNECLENWVKKSGSKLAIEYIDVENSKQNWNCNFEQFNELVGKARHRLILNGIKKGDAVAFAYQNSPELILLSWAAWTLGVKTVPLDTKRDDLEMMEYKMNLAGVKILLSKEKIGLKSGVKSVVLSVNNLEDVQAGKNNNQQDVELISEALVLFTSGTTAKPKGVLLTQENLMANADGVADWLKITPNDKFMITLPLHHINSTTMCLATFIRGGAVVLTSRYSNSGFWKLAVDSGATLTSVVPTIIHDQLGQMTEFNRLKPRIKLSRIQLGSAPVVVAEAESFTNLSQIPLIQGYGQTETALRSTGVNWSQEKPLSRNYWNNLRSNTIGSEMKWTNVTVLKEDGVESRQEEEGEICVKGPVIMKEYINNPVETKKAFEYGWFHSGDLGYWKIIGSEKQFFIKGRLKEIIIKAGTNVSPLFVEQAVRKSLQGIDQVYVIGIPDERAGEEIGAIAVWKNGKFRKLPKGIKGLLKFETPVLWFSVLAQDLPMTSTGKVQRVKLKEMFSRCAVIAETDKFMFRVVSPAEDEVMEEARQMYNARWQPLSADKKVWTDEIRKKVIIGAFDKATGRLGGWIRVKTEGKIVTADAVTSGLSKPEVCETSSRVVKFRQLHAEEVEIYLRKKIDPVIEFHRRPKAGWKQGAKVVKVVKNARPGDTPALGYGVMMEYPEFAKMPPPKISAEASLGVQLVEAAMILGKRQGFARVRVLSRPVGLLKWINKRYFEDRR